MCCIYRKALKTVLFVSLGAGPYLRRWSFVRGISTSCVVIPHRPPAFVTSMISGTSTREKVQLPSGRFAACWPIGLGTYNGRAAVFLASGRRILNPRDEVLPVPVVEEAVPLLAEASGFTMLFVLQILFLYILVYNLVRTFVSQLTGPLLDLIFLLRFVKWVSRGHINFGSSPLIGQEWFRNMPTPLQLEKNRLIS